MDESNWEHFVEEFGKIIKDKGEKEAEKEQEKWLVEGKQGSDILLVENWSTFCVI